MDCTRYINYDELTDTYTAKENVTFTFGGVTYETEILDEIEEALRQNNFLTEVFDYEME